MTPPQAGTPVSQSPLALELRIQVIPRPVAGHRFKPNSARICIDRKRAARAKRTPGRADCLVAIPSDLVALHLCLFTAEGIGLEGGKCERNKNRMFRQMFRRGIPRSLKII